MAHWRPERCSWEIWLKIYFNNYLIEVVLDYILYIMYYCYWNKKGMFYLKIMNNIQTFNTPIKIK